MLHISLNQVIQRIKDHSDLTSEQIQAKIKEKTQALSGLISEEGAAYIIANEMGIKLLAETSGILKIKDILAGMRSVDTAGKVQTIYELREFEKGDKKGKVGSFIIADDTSSIRVVLWNDMADKLKDLKEDMTIKVEGAYVRENNGRKEVHLGDKGELTLNPSDIKIENVRKFGEAERKKISDLTEEDSNVEVFGTIIDLREPRFYEICPTCNKRVKMAESGFACDTHGSVEADFGYVMNVMVDDGSDTINMVFFRNQAERLLGKTKEEMLALKDKPEDLPALRSEFIGRFVKVIGRVNKNTMFDRLEFTSQLVFTDINPEEEMKRLNQEVKDVEEALSENSKEEEVVFDDDKKEEVEVKVEETVSEEPKTDETKKDDFEDDLKSIDDLDPILS